MASPPPHLSPPPPHLAPPPPHPPQKNKNKKKLYPFYRTALYWGGGGGGDYLGEENCFL